MRLLPTLILQMLIAVSQAGAAPPSGFVAVREAVSGIVVDLRYRGAANFVGEPIDGYEADRCYLTVEAATALSRVQDDLRGFGLGLKVFDAYRPQRAVDHFARWARDPQATATKARYYPEVDKSHLFRDGYIARRSGHSRGSTVDLTLVALEGGVARELDMGTPFDFFGPASHGDSRAVTGQQRANRLLLQTLMVKHGFRPLAEEWWHFTLADEPYPETYFDFPVR